MNTIQKKSKLSACGEGEFKKGCLALRFSLKTSGLQVGKGLRMGHVNARQGLEGPAAGGLRQQWSGLGPAEPRKAHTKGMLSLQGE